MDVQLFAVTEHGDHLSGVRDVVQVRELLLFLVVVDCGDSARDQHGHQDGHTFDPGCVTMFLVVTSFHGNGNEGSYDKNFESEIIKRLDKQFPQRFKFLRRFFVMSEMLFPGFDGSWLNAVLSISLKISDQLRITAMFLDKVNFVSEGSLLDVVDDFN